LQRLDQAVSRCNVHDRRGVQREGRTDQNGSSFLGLTKAAQPHAAELEHKIIPANPTGLDRTRLLRRIADATCETTRDGSGNLTGLFRHYCWPE
jgi:hypothetical protein